MVDKQHYGNDLSLYQTIDWAKYDPDFMEFAILKTWQGGWVDPKYFSHVAGCQRDDVRCPHANYLLHDKRYSKERQFDGFMGARIPGLCGDSLDLQWYIPGTDVLWYLKSGLRETGRGWLLYTNYNILNLLRPYADEILKVARIWLAWPWGSQAAAMNAASPVIPGYGNPLVWQFSWTAQPGWVQRRVDRNRFEGTEAQWLQFISAEGLPLTLEEKVEKMWNLRHSH